jgi:hypothetical protein
MTAFVDTIKKLAETVGTALGGPIVPAVIEIGQDLLELIDNAKEVVGNKNAKELEVIRSELEPKVMAHADKTEANLRG